MTVVDKHTCLESSVWQLMLWLIGSISLYSLFVGMPTTKLGSKLLSDRHTVLILFAQENGVYGVGDNLPRDNIPRDDSPRDNLPQDN